MIEQAFFYEGRGQRQIYRLVYYSVNLMPVGAPQKSGMTDLIYRAQARNAGFGISGVLLSDERYFSQLLEGPRDVVETVMGSIRRDRRHRDIVVTEEGFQGSRSFEGWAMDLVCDARARLATGRGAHALGANVNSADAFAAQMAYVVNKVPATWSAPRGA